MFQYALSQLLPIGRSWSLKIPPRTGSVLTSLNHLDIPSLKDTDPISPLCLNVNRQKTIFEDSAHSSKIYRNQQIG
ncbi:hypothetical protein NECAME_09030, partial [Necator americanus]